MIRFVIVAFCLFPVLAQAAYQDPVIEAVQVLPNGTTQVNLRFDGNAGEPPVQLSYVVRAGSNLRAAREWVKDVIDELDGVKTAAAIPGLQPGQTITRVARVNPARLAKQIWNEKYAIYERIQGSDVPALASVKATLKTWLDTNWQAGFLDE